MDRAALYAFEAELGANTSVLRVVQHVLRVRRSVVCRMLKQLDTRPAAANAVRASRGLLSTD